MQPKGTQFPKYEFTSVDRSDVGEQQYEVWKRHEGDPEATFRGGGDPGYKAVGSMTVALPTDHTYFSYPGEDGYGTAMQDAVKPGNYNENWQAASREPQLFGVHGPEPTPPTVEMLEMTKQDRAMAPTLLGIGQIESIRRSGQGLTPSTDLSDHSDRMVGKLANRGAIDDWGGRERWNDMDFLPESPYSTGEDMWQRHYGPHAVPRQDVSAGRSLSRNLLRRKRGGPVGTATGAVQGTLF